MNKDPKLVNGSATRVGVIIAAAGTSTRMDGADKILANLNGHPVFSYSVEVFEKWAMTESIVIVASDSNISNITAIAAQRNWRKLKKVVEGGLRRQDSVRKGLEAIGNCDWIIVHDAARPFISIEMLDRGMILAQSVKCTVAAYPAVDTLKRSLQTGIIASTIDRSNLYFVQTPQIFQKNILEKAHSEIKQDVTDDASMIEIMGESVCIFEGSRWNFKITFNEDLEAAEALIKGKFL